MRFPRQRARAVAFASQCNAQARPEVPGMEGFRPRGSPKPRGFLRNLARSRTCGDPDGRPDTRQIGSPFRGSLRKQENATVLLGDVTGVDPERRCAFVDSVDRERVPFGYDS